MVSVAVLVVLALPVLTGPEVDGVTRWLPLGPLALNSGLLTVPLLALTASRDKNLGWAFLAAALLIVSMQPDAATAFAVTGALGVSAWTQRQWWGLLFATAGLIVGSFLFQLPSPPSFPFVEYLIPMLWQEMGVPIQAVGLGVLLLAPVFYLLRSKHGSPPQRQALIVVYLAFLGSSFVGPYPVPLAGYGASSILGFMIALAYLSEPSRSVDD
tara:strand:+ start:254 stop:892 length:639 start_codon:yes stop_codon:yes gene_type:complete